MFITSFDELFKRDEVLANYMTQKRVEGFTFGESRRIYINSDADPKRQRFTIAHELGHILLNHIESGKGSMAFRDSTSTKSSDPIELAANSFAAELLMPERLMVEMYKKTDSPSDLAVIFGVSIESMKRRIRRLEQIGAI